MRWFTILRKHGFAGSGLLLLVAVALSGCRTLATEDQMLPDSPQARTSQVAAQPAATPVKSDIRNKRRRMITARRNPYEGSLWQYESSFGNLFRDHRARFRGDLLSISELQAIVSVPPPREQEEGGEQAPASDTARANILLEALTMRDQIEEEQNEILRGLEIISARVVRVLPDGNMVIRGRKVDYRQRNKVRYITTVTGILRPADVSDTNIVSAAKLAYPDVKIKRQQSGSLLREKLERLAPLTGKQQAGLAGRLSEFAGQ
ncbi:MAG: flagellar basal body L-ring protein FlgH [SAR324 cluster bacterium]|nr:flagellar basal body L-ring protein FlgH [SAR324 cluster bacterium]